MHIRNIYKLPIGIEMLSWKIYNLANFAGDYGNTSGWIFKIYSFKETLPIGIGMPIRKIYNLPIGIGMPIRKIYNLPIGIGKNMTLHAYICAGLKFALCDPKV